MNPPPALVDAFVARLESVLEHLRDELRDAGDVVLVHPAPEWHYKRDIVPTPEQEHEYLVIAAERAHASFQNPPSGMTGGAANANPEVWPVGLPLPLTVADALAAVTSDRERIAAELAEELSRLVAALVPAEHQAGALEDTAIIAAWPWPGRTLPSGGSVALSDLLSRVRELPPGEDRHPVRGDFLNQRGPFPWAFAWARSSARSLDLRGDGVPSVYEGETGAVWVEPHPGMLASPPPAALNALYRHLWARSPLFAAMQAGRIVGDLVSDEGSRLWLAAVDAALTPSPGEPDALADEARADVRRRKLYEGELIPAARAVAAAVFVDPPPVDDNAARELAGNPPALLWDRRFAAELDRLGGARAPAVLADAVARASSGADLWHLWAPVDGSPRWLRWLARELWLSLWRPALARERRPVALSLFAVESFGGVLLGRDVAPGPGGRDVLVDGAGRAVARFELPRLATLVDADALERLARPGVGELTTIAAARFVPWFAEQVQRRPVESDALVFEGADGVNAWGSVALALGMNASGAGDEVCRMIHALQATIIQYPNGDEAGVLMFDYRKGGGRGNPSRLTIRPGRAWLSSDVHELPEGAEYRALAPIPRLEGYAPPFVGDRRERAALARLWLCLLVELTREAPDLSLGLGAHIPGARWAELANTVGVKRPPPVLVSLLQNRWAADGDDGRAVLERVGPDRWHLAPRFEAERIMLETGGRMRRGAAEGGRRAARGRAEERGRLADGLPRKPGGRKS